MLVLIGKMENQFLELEPAKLSPSLNSIYLLSTLHSTLMDQVGAHKANDTVPFIASFCNLSPCPLRWVWMPEAKLALWRDRVGLPTSTLCCQPTGSQVRRTFLAVTVVQSRQETLRKGKGQEAGM